MALLIVMPLAVTLIPLPTLALAKLTDEGVAVTLSPFLIPEILKIALAVVAESYTLLMPVAEIVRAAGVMAIVLAT